MLLQRNISLALVLAISACATSGKSFDPDRVSHIDIGRSSQAEIRRMFGEPVKLQVQGSGGSSWKYDYREVKTRDTGIFTRIARFVLSLFGVRSIGPPVNVRYSNEIRHQLTVFFDDYGTVRDFTYERTDKPSKKIY